MNHVQEGDRLELVPRSVKESTLQLEHQLRGIELQNAELKFTQTQLIGSMESELREREITSYEQQCRAERDRITTIQTNIAEEQVRIERTQCQIEELSTFIVALSEIGIRDSGSFEDLTSRDAADVEEAIVNSIKTVSMKTTTVWHRIMGLATKDAHPSPDYTIAIQRICDDRARFKLSRNIGDFWKSLAKKDANNKGLVTPSYSQQSVKRFEPTTPQQEGSRSRRGPFLPKSPIPSLVSTLPSRGEL